MKSKFLKFIEETTNPANYQDSKIPELTTIDNTLKQASHKLQSKVSMVEELIEDHDYQVIRANNVYIPGIKEARVVLDAIKAYKAKTVTPKKKN